MIQPSIRRLVLPAIVLLATCCLHLSPVFGQLLGTDSAPAATPPGEPLSTVLRRVASDTLGPQVTHLENGLQVIVKERPAAPVVAINVWIHAGSRNEAKGQEGYAHLLEHMLFKGTPRFKTGELDRAIKQLGADNNAFTAADYTCYHVFGAAEHFPRLLDLLSDAVLNSLLDPIEFEKEKKVVLEELRMDLDDPESTNYNAVKEIAFTTHPYRHPIIGYPSSIEPCDRDSLYAFYKKYYVPSNMVVVVVGDVRPEVALAEVRKCFGSAPKVPTPPQDVPAEPRQNTRREVVQVGEVNQAYLDLAWHVPGISSPDNVVLDVLMTLLGSGRSSRLHSKIVEELRLATSIAAAYYTGQDPSLFWVRVQLPQSGVREVIERATGLVYQLREELVPAAELDKAKQQIISSAIFGRESPAQLAETYGHYATLGFFEEADAYLDRVRAVTPEDLRRVAREYFRDGNLNIARYEPRAASATQVPEMITLDNGVRLILKENHASPIVAMQWLIDAGGLREEKGQAGIANLCSRTLLKGTDSLKADEIARRFESLGAQVNTRAYKSFSEIKLVTLSEKFMPAFRLLGECTVKPAFPAEEVEKEANRAIEGLKSIDDDLFSFTLFRTLGTLFPDTPLAYPAPGIEKEVRNLKRTDIATFHKRHHVGEGMVVAIVGNFYSTEVKRELVEILGRIPKGAADKLKPAKLPELARPVLVENRKDKEQAQIVFATRTFPRHDPRYPALQVLRSILSGSMSSRLFTNLRDKDSLAYSVWATTAALPVTGYFYAALSTSPNRLETAVNRLLEELEAILRSGFTAQELDEARQYVVGQYALEQVTNEQQADLFATDEFMGLGFDYFRKYPEQIKAVTAEEVQTVASAVLLLRRNPEVASGPIPAEGQFILSITRP